MSRIDPSLTISADFARLPDALVAEAAKLPTATLHEAAGRIGALPSVIKPVGPAMQFAGSALPIHSPGGDNLWIHRAMAVARPGDVLVVNVSDAYEYGYWGEVMTTAAKTAGLAGLVIDGGVRDGRLLEEIGFPVFSRPICIRGTGKDFGARGFVGHPVLMGEVVVRAGDLIVGDSDGVVALPAARASEIIVAAQAREAYEAALLVRLEAGETTMDVFGFDK